MSRTASTTNPSSTHVAVAGCGRRTLLTRLMALVAVAGPGRRGRVRRRGDDGTATPSPPSTTSASDHPVRSASAS